LERFSFERFLKKVNKQGLIVQILMGVHGKSQNMMVRVECAIILAVLRGFESLRENYGRELAITSR